VSTSFANQIWREVMGYPLTIANDFPRNDGQSLSLWSLSEFHFLPDRWSLRKLLTTILTAPSFNRLSPAATSSATPYVLPRFFDPWTEIDPRYPPVALTGWTPGGPPPSPDPAYDPSQHPADHNNAMSEAVHRYSPRSLLYSVHAALGWPAPRRFYDRPYPSAELAKAIGQFWRDSEPGFRETDFQGLLQWEARQGACANPDTATPDWIDRLVDGAQASGSAFTHEQLAVVVRDWLLGHGEISSTTPPGVPAGTSERQALETLLGVPLSSNVDLSTVASRAALKDQLRGYCGVLVETPQFWLAGIAPTDLGPQPALRVCNDPNDCSYTQMCQPMVPWFRSVGWDVDCSHDPVTATPVSRRPFNLDDICPRGRCGFEPAAIDDCLGRKAPLFGCVPPEPPPCDPRCARIDCCGGPLPPLDRDAGFAGFMLAWADGGIVRRADGIRVRGGTRPGAPSEWRSLKRGERLRAGDLLEILPGGRLEVDAPAGRFRTPRGGLPANGRYGGWFFQVTGPSVLERRDAHLRLNWDQRREDLEMVAKRRELERLWRPTPEFLEGVAHDEQRRLSAAAPSDRKPTPNPR
jgi:hypothetical protein